jgi:hypothetical protein
VTARCAANTGSHDSDTVEGLQLLGATLAEVCAITQAIFFPICSLVFEMIT